MSCARVVGAERGGTALLRLRDEPAEYLSVGMAGGVVDRIERLALAGRREEHQSVAPADVLHLPQCLFAADAQAGLGLGAAQGGDGKEAMPEPDQHVDACPQVDGKPDEHGKQAVAAAEVLVEEDEHGLVEDMDVAERRLLRAFALVVQDGGGDVGIAPAGQQEAVGEVDVLAVHEEGFVEQPHLTDCLAAHHEEGSADDLDAVGLRARQVAHVVAAEATAVGKEGAEPRHLAEGRPGSRHAATAFPCKAAPPVVHRHAGGSHFGMAVEIADAVGEGALRHDGVGVEQQDVAACGAADGLVVGVGEAPVVGVGNEAHLGEAGAEIVDGGIGRVVVDHKDLHVQAALRCKHGMQALLKVVLDIVADDDNGEVCHSLPSSSFSPRGSPSA